MTATLRISCGLAVLCTLLLAGRGFGAPKPVEPIQLMDIFELEYASDPQVSADGQRIVYVRNFMDIQKDRRRSNLWVIDADGGNHRPLTSGPTNDRAPRWSPDGRRLLYLTGADGSTQLQCRWMDTGQTATLARFDAEVAGFSWSPDGRAIALSVHVPERPRPFVDLPARPAGADWAEPFQMIRHVNYRHDGKGYLKAGRFQVFLLSADGGTPRQLSDGPFDHRGTPAWTPDGQALILSANRQPSADYDPLDTEIYELKLADNSLRPLTVRQGPDTSPVVSPDGKRIAYLGFDDRRQGYQVTRLYVMNRDGSGPRS
jgi:acylaminoacyl-peptidase